jgi:hypothetical protein
VRRDDGGEHTALVVRLTDEANVAEAQIAEASVHELRGRPRGRAPEVARVQERHREPRPGGVGGDPGANDSPADDKQVEPPTREFLDDSSPWTQRSAQPRAQPW